MVQKKWWNAMMQLLATDGQALTLVYVDSTKGWINFMNAEDDSAAAANIFNSNRWNNYNSLYKF